MNDHEVSLLHAGCARVCCTWMSLPCERLSFCQSGSMQKIPLCSQMTFRQKIKMLVEWTPLLVYDPEQYVTELFEIGDCINLFKPVRRYVLGQIMLNSDNLDASTHQILAQWIDMLVELSPLEDQICEEIRSRFESVNVQEADQEGGCT